MLQQIRRKQDPSYPKDKAVGKHQTNKYSRKVTLKNRDKWSLKNAALGGN